MLRQPTLEIPPTGGLPLVWRDFLPASTTTLASRLAGFIGVDEVSITCSGTAALVIALHTLITQSVDTARREVVVPAFTCPLVAMAIVHCGLDVVLCDVQPNHFDFDHARLAKLCSNRTLAVIPTHLGGRLADVDAAMMIASSVGAWTIEDAAQSLGARHRDGIAAGLIGDIGLFSMAAGKGLTLYEGGALVTRHAALRASMRDIAAKIAPRRWRWELRRCIELLGYTVLYHPRRLHLPYGRPLRQALRRGDVDRAAGDVFPAKIPLHSVGTWRQNLGARAALRLPAHIDRLRKQAEARLPMLREIKGLQVLDDGLMHDPGLHDSVLHEPVMHDPRAHVLDERALRDVRPAQGTWPVMIVLLPDRTTRDAVLAALWPAGVGVSCLFAHALPDYASLRCSITSNITSDITNCDTQNARDFAARSMTISNSHWLDDATFTRILDTLRAACERLSSKQPLPPSSR